MEYLVIRGWGQTHALELNQGALYRAGATSRQHPFIYQPWPLVEFEEWVKWRGVEDGEGSQSKVKNALLK